MTHSVKHVQGVFGAEFIESNEAGPTLLKLGNVDAVCARAMESGARSIAEPEDKPYNERQAGFVDVSGNTWWVST